MNDFIARLLSNPDDISVYQELHSISGNQWFLDLSSDLILELLGIQDCYSNGVEVISRSVSLVTSSYCKSITFPNQHNLLCEFLLNSLNKQDVLKPYFNANTRKLPERKLLKIENATCICSPLSIAILDSESKVVKEASHNACEALYLWWLHSSQSINCKHLDTALFGSVQQTFNLGHWFIDSLARLSYALPLLEHLENLTVLVDTIDHKIIRDSLSFFGVNHFKPTLPYSVYKIETLYVPILESFSDRVEIAATIVDQMYPIEKSLPNSSLGLVNPSQIYLSRQNLDRRKIINHDSVDALLKKFNVSTVHPQELDLYTMNRLIKESQIVFGPNGAAMCNLLFASDSPTKVGILYPPTHLDDYYFLVSNALSFNFYASFTHSCGNWSNLNDMINSYYYPRVAEDYSVDSSFIFNMLSYITSLN